MAGHPSALDPGPEGVDVVESGRVFDWLFGLIFVAVGVWFVVWGDIGAKVVGLAAVVAGLFPIARPRRVLLAEGGIEVHSYLGRRFVPWTEVADVRVRRTGLVRQLVIELSTGRDIVPEGIGSLRRCGARVDGFAARASKRCSGPARARAAPPSRRRRWLRIAAVAVILLALAMSLT